MLLSLLLTIGIIILNWTIVVCLKRTTGMYSAIVIVIFLSVALAALITLIVRSDYPTVDLYIVLIIMSCSIVFFRFMFSITRLKLKRNSNDFREKDLNSNKKNLSFNEIVTHYLLPIIITVYQILFIWVPGLFESFLS